MAQVQVIRAGFSGFSGYSGNSTSGYSGFCGIGGSGYSGFSGSGGTVDTTSQILQGDGAGGAVASLIGFASSYYLSYEYDDAVRQTTLVIANYTDGAASSAQLELDSDTQNAQISVLATSFGVAGVYSGGDTKFFATSRIVIASTGAIVFSNDGGNTEIARIDDALQLTPVAAFPASPVEGMIVAKTDHHLYYYNGTTWKQLDN